MPSRPEEDEHTPSPASAGGRAAPGERRQQILAAAMQCFSEKGFRGTTTRDLAARVGITEAALYRHFPSKEALYSAIIDEKRAAPDQLEDLRGAAEAGDDRAVFDGLAHQLLERIDSDPSFLRILLYTGLEGHALAEPFFAQRIRRLREFLAGYIGRRSDQGAFRPIDPRLAARAFLGMVVDYVIVREVFHQRDAYPMSRAEVADTFVSIFLDGVRAPDGPDRG